METTQVNETVGSNVATPVAGEAKAKRVRKTPAAKVMPATATHEATRTAARPDTDTPLVGTGANVPAQMKEAAKSFASLAQENARLQKELRATQTKLKAVSEGEDVKLPVTDAQLGKAADALVELTRANPGTPNRSLRSQFRNQNGTAVFVGDISKEQVKDLDPVTPELTPEQRKRVWTVAKSKIDAIHDKWTREEAPVIYRHLKRATSRKSPAVMRARVRKDKTGKIVKDVMMGAKFLPKKKPDAKPTV